MRRASSPSARKRSASVARSLRRSRSRANRCAARAWPSRSDGTTLPSERRVHDVQATSIGGFVQAGEKVMEVVPMGDKLLVETRVKPSDIASSRSCDKALVKVTAYELLTYGGLDGRVVQVRPTAFTTRSSARPIFIVIVETTKAI